MSKRRMSGRIGGSGPTVDSSPRSNPTRVGTDDRIGPKERGFGSGSAFETNVPFAEEVVIHPSEASSE